MILQTESNENIKQIKRDLENCKKCGLWETRTHVVVGDGSVDAKIMLIGEAPGKNEDLQGVPFIGRAGKLLDELLSSIDLERKDIYIANLLKCRPPKNRNPKKIEIETCTPYLDKQIEMIKPKVIGTLGNFSSSYILEKFKVSVESIGKIHGEIIPINIFKYKLVLMPLYHPAAAIYNPNLKKVLIKDFTKIKQYIYDI